jgi:hypothetical protein
VRYFVVRVLAADTSVLGSDSRYSSGEIFNKSSRCPSAAFYNGSYPLSTNSNWNTVARRGEIS